MSESPQTGMTVREATKDNIDVRSSNRPQSPGFGSTDVKEIGAVSEDHHAVQEIGAAALKKKTEDGAAEFLSEFIYEHDSAWPREWLQNHESACIRRAKFLIRLSDEYPEGWLRLSLWIDQATGETVVDYDDDQTLLADYDGEAKDLREIQVPRPIDEVLEAARSLGYDPTIVWDVYRDERKIVTEDNGDGMTPSEFDEHFNTVFGSKSKHDAETGGMIGIGSESAAIVHGKEGGMECELRSTRPTENGEIRKGFRAYSYLGGGNIIPGEVEEGFIGARFKIPVKESFDLSNLQGWVEDYADKLRVPLLYREHDAGSTPVEEEYEATNFVEDYDDPPVVIERPGEFTVVAGPDALDTSYNSDEEDTFLVSMHIDRNTSVSISTFWDVVIQIHDEQGRIVAGPNRGKYDEDVDLHEDDVVLPEPTGDRDRLQKDENSKGFFNYVEDLVKAREFEEVNKVTEAMKEADHPGQAIQGDKEAWDFFDSMVGCYGRYKVKQERYRFKNFIDSEDNLPDLSDETQNQMFSLFEKIEYCNRGASSSTTKRGRVEKRLGDFLSQYGNNEVYMAASSGGNFTDYFKVVKNTHPNAEIILVSGSRKYDDWSNFFGFKVLNDVPLTHAGEDEDHDYDVPQNIHDKHKNKHQSRKKAENIEDRELKIRTNFDNSSIDLRLSITRTQEVLENGSTFGGQEKLILFPRTGNANISDNYRAAKYEAIASVSQEEYDLLADYDRVMTYEEYQEWSNSALIDTEDGEMTPRELISDDRLVILTYQPRGEKDVEKLLTDEYEQLRGYYAEDVKEQVSWTKALPGYDSGYAGDNEDDVDESDKPDTLFAVADSAVLSRARWAFRKLKLTEDYGNGDMIGLELVGSTGSDVCTWTSLTKSTTRYRLMTDTPNWDDDSKIYDMMPKDRDRRKAQLYLAFHDMGVDPSEHEGEELRKLIS